MSQPNSEQTIFSNALEIKNANEREAYLVEACGDNAKLLADVRNLLAIHEQEVDFLDKPASSIVKNMSWPPTKQFGMAPEQTMPSSLEPQIGQIVAYRYRIEGRLGEGGMGTVWVAEQSDPVKRKVALKLIKAGMDSMAVSHRFAQERQALALMDHPNIARVYDGGLTENYRPYFAMELVTGPALMRYCDEEKLGIRQRLELFIPICRAVQHAHQKGIIHRDLKPNNILVTKVDGKAVPKVIDFGVAKAVSGKITDLTLNTQIGAVVGTLEYMSPEQATVGEDVDTRTDIYSLGVILYELLTGLRPIDEKRFKKAALLEMIRIIREEEPSKPSTRVSTSESAPTLAALRHTEPKKLTSLLRGDLDWVIMKCLEKPRERRYETASGLARDIERFLNNEVVEARSPSASYKALKFIRRHKKTVLTASLVIVALVAGIIGTTYGMYQAEQKRREAEQAKVQEENQRKIAEKANESAQTNASMARKVIQEFLIQIGDDKFSAIPQFEMVRKELVDKAVQRYREMLKMQPENESLKSDAAEIMQRSANLYRMMNQFPAAMPLYEEAVGIYRGLMKDNPNHVPYFTHLSLILTDWSAMLVQYSGPSVAEPKIREAAELSRKIVERQNDGNTMLALAKSIMAWAGTLKAMSQFDEAIKKHQEAIGILCEFADRSDSVPQFRFLAVFELNNLAQTAREAKQLALVENSLRNAIERGTKSATAPGNTPNDHYLLAWTYLESGLLRMMQGKSKEALDALNSSVSKLDQLVKDFPKVASFRRKLAESHTAKGRWYYDENQLNQAFDESQRAIELLEQLEKESNAAHYHSYLAIAYNLAGRIAHKKSDTKNAMVLFRKADDRFTVALSTNAANVTLQSQKKDNEVLLNSIK